MTVKYPNSKFEIIEIANEYHQTVKKSKFY